MVSPAIGIAAVLCCANNKADANAEHDKASMVKEVDVLTDIGPQPTKKSKKKPPLLKEAVNYNYWSTFTANSNVAVAAGVNVPTS